MASFFSRIYFTLLLCTQLHAASADFEQWIVEQRTVCVQKINEHISPADCSPGVVIASPSRSEPDYYYHWVRDAALVLQTVHALPELFPHYERYLEDYVQFSLRNQLSSAQAGLGEPKFYVDGRPYEEEWGRPQNDGPALRAITAIQYAHELLDRGRESEVRTTLYNSDVLSQTLIPTDLRYLVDNWYKCSFDLWEEVLGEHFYTLMVQRRALRDGAQLATRLGDAQHAECYNRLAERLEEDILAHINPHTQVIQTSRRFEGGLSYKASGLDISVILALLHADRDDGFLGVTHPAVLRSAEVLIERFHNDYTINQTGLPGTLLGRYPEDRYFGGNPWFLSTLAIAELYYRAATSFEAEGKLAQAQELRRQADAQLERLRYHTPDSGIMDEQLDRYTGYMTGAPDLTWSYASFLTALRAR